MPASLARTSNTAKPSAASTACSSTVVSDPLPSCSSPTWTRGDATSVGSRQAATESLLANTRLWRGILRSLTRRMAVAASSMRVQSSLEVTASSGTESTSLTSSEPPMDSRA